MLCETGDGGTGSQTTAEENTGQQVRDAVTEMQTVTMATWKLPGLPGALRTASHDGLMEARNLSQSSAQHKPLGPLFNNGPWKPQHHLAQVCPCHLPEPSPNAEGASASTSRGSVPRCWPWYWDSALWAGGDLD